IFFLGAYPEFLLRISLWPYLGGCREGIFWLCSKSSLARSIRQLAGVNPERLGCFLTRGNYLNAWFMWLKGSALIEENRPGPHLVFGSALGDRIYPSPW